MDELNDITVIPAPTEEKLNKRQLVDYRQHRKECLSWLLTFGKEPGKVKGYAQSTVEARAYRMDQFYRWVWEQEGHYTTDITHEHADGWMKELAHQDKSNVHKSNCQKSVQMLFKWHKHEHNWDNWDPEIRFSDSSGASQPRDYLTMDERKKIREAALEYGSVPHYNHLSPEGRDHWKAYLAQRFEKPKNEVSPEDWDKANDWKIPSLVWTSLDAGLRPIEVERAVIGWLDLKNGVLRIPKEESSKNNENWVVGLRDKTANILKRWVKQRKMYDMYDDTDKIWLTRQANPYSSASLRHVLRRLCDIAGISTDNRKMSWYSIRHSVGTYMTREEDLAAAQAQLRHKSEKTTMKYDQTPVEDRKDALDRMG
ncbi:tyrosine-type recombinase/integrase [Halorutilales archaeon Cl-col2-1]